MDHALENAMTFLSFFFQAEDGIRDADVTGVQTCALPIWHPLGGWELELPAGLIEEGEEPLDCARRELQEETGYLASSWKKIGWVHTLPGITRQRAHVFLAQKLQRGKAHREVGEIMIRQVVLFAEAYRVLT